MHTVLPACMRTSALLQGHLAQVVGTKLLPFSRGIQAHKKHHYTMKVFLDIEIGDREAYSRDLAAYRVTAEFLEQVGSQVMRCINGMHTLPCVLLLGTLILTRIFCSTERPFRLSRGP